MLRRLIPILIFVAGAILGKPLALSSIGLALKAYFYFENGWLLSYGSIDWHEGRLILKEIDLKEPAGSLNAQSLSVFWSARHLEMEKPRLRLRGIPHWKGGDSDWTVEIKEGKVALEGLGEFCFSFERTWRASLGRLVIEKGSSSLAVEAIQEESEVWIDATLRGVEAALLKPWIDLKGTADGRVHLVFVGNECKRGSAHLDFKEGGLGSLLLLGEGAIDWEGEVGKNFLAKCFESARIRLQLSKGSLLGPKGKLEEIKGLLSFTAGVGAKWDFTALGTALEEEFPIGFSGRAFLHDSRPFWAELQLTGQSARISIAGKEETAGFRWTGALSTLNDVEGTLIQSLAATLVPAVEPFEFEQGTVDFDGEALFGKAEAFEFPFLYGSCMLKVKDFAARYETSSLFSKSGWLEWTSEQNGAFDFMGASGQTALANGKPLLFEEWEGNGAIEKGILVHSHFAGTVEKEAAVLEATGTLGAFHIDAHGKNGEIACKGVFDERFDLEIEEGRIKGLSFGGKAWVEPAGSFWLHLNRFEGALSPLFHALGSPQELDGHIGAVGEGFLAEGDSSSFNWFLQARGELGQNIGFYCPIFQKEGDCYSFDIRIDTPNFEMLRLVAKLSGGEATFDCAKTHLLGEPVQSASCVYDSEGIASASLKVPLSWNSFALSLPIWLPKASELIALPLEGTSLVALSYSRAISSIAVDGQNLLWEGNPVSLSMAAATAKGALEISTLQVNECAIKVTASQEGERLCFTDGRASWKGGAEADFSGFVDTSFDFEFSLPYLKVHLGELSPFAASLGIPALQGLDGILEGRGIVSRSNKIEADFDLISSGLKTREFDLQNQGAIHLRYASDAGIFCSGLNLFATGPKLPFFGCQVELLKFDSLRSVWMLNGASLQLPPKFLGLFPNLPPILTHFDAAEEIRLCLDLECPSDFSSLSFFVKDAEIPALGHLQPIRNLSFSFDQTEMKAAFELDHQNCPVKVSTEVRLGDLSSGGRLTLEGENLHESERPLSIAWTYAEKGGLLIHEIEGQFGGIEASFHALDEGRTLIGSARINFRELGPLIPPRISQVFTDLKMGQGYELKGKLFLDPGISFRGLFTGKQIDLFGYQLRTLLSQCELDADRVRLCDLKISDSAGIFKIDELVAETLPNNPWTLSIPHLSLLELRPSLLQKPGSEPKEAGPLVVREMKIENVQGLLEDSKTYTAKGELSFINSFRREHTVFDIPSDLLGRIVGLDLALLIPACGNLEYELKNGFFTLTSLYDSYSEGKRSEFFLVPDPAPRMDLDGNLQIYVSMKQFVLFKLTESFQILVDGQLGDPQFHLQKKSRFLGL
jgi:hypothetical protein